MENEILICLEWLDKQDFIKTINTKHHSYELKHLIEDWCKSYISEDAFIEAVRIKGITFQHVPFNKKSIYLPISEKTIRLYRDREVKMRNGEIATIPALRRQNI